MEKDPNLFAEVFNQRAAITTIMGTLGGTTRALFLKTDWRETIRVVVIGGLVAFGVGVLAPTLLPEWIKVPEDSGLGTGILTSSSYLIGILAVTIMEKFTSEVKASDVD